MKITHNKVGTNLNTSDSAKADKTERVKSQTSAKANGLDDLAAKDSGASKVDLSPRAQEMKKIKDAAMAAPDIDEAKVAKYQKMIDEGTYKVSAQDIADKMVDEEMKWVE